MKNISYLILLFIVIITSLAHSSDYKLITEERRFGFGLNILGPSIATSLSANYYITPHYKAEAGAGWIGYFGGMTYHFGGSRVEKVMPYVGLYISEIENWWYHELHPCLYIPLGVGGIGDKGASVHVELAFFRSMESNKYLLWGCLKLGHYFRK